MRAKEPLFYPILGAERDLGFLRLSGHGIGNGLYPYFHAVALAERFSGQVITPAWRSVKPARILAGKFKERSYWNTFRSHRSEIRGLRKALALISLRGAKTINGSETDEAKNINNVFCYPFTFEGLHEYRDLIRKRFLDISVESPPSGFQWGRGNYIAIHVRLGDFGSPASETELLSGKVNLRIPLEWYVGIVERLRAQFPDLPIRVLSDGSEEELTPLLRSGAQLYRTGSDIGDLFALAGCCLLVGSNSTYSRWAAFLGNMPSIWLATGAKVDSPTSLETPVVYAEINTNIDLSGMMK